MAILSKYKLEKYQYGVHVQKLHQLYGMSGKIIYNGQWRLSRDDRIIIVEMNEAIAEREALFYLEVNGHNNIIRTLGYVENISNLTIFIQEFAEQGDLADMLMDNQFNITQPILVEMFEQIADAMTYIAGKSIVHGDLGCRNVLVFKVDPDEPKNNLVKITDFGLARWTERPPANEDLTIIPIRYCAPEILQRNQHASYSEKSDVYSMGVLIWEALSNSEIPYSSDAKDEDVTRKKLNNERLPRPLVCDRQLWVFMNSCWHNDPQQRPTFEEIKDKLSDIKISEVPDAQITSLFRAETHYDYELDVDVKIKALLNDGSPSIYEAQWISKEGRPIILIEKNEDPSEYERLFYTTFNNHKHLVHTFGFVENDRQSIMILQERAPYGYLQTLLKSGRFNPSAKVLLEIFSQIIDAMRYIVDQGLIHGDLRCENVLVFEMHPSEPRKNLIKLTNFGLAHRNDPSFVDNRRLVIPARYCALEILRSAGRSNYSELSDVYSMGVLMWQACSKGKIPYESSITNGEIRQRKLNGEKLPRPLLCDGRIWSVMEDCWLNEPLLRYVFKEINTRLSHIDPDSIETYQYKLNVNVKQKRSLNITSGKFYEADWIPKKEPSIILLVMDDETAEREASFYMKFNSHPHIIHTFGFVENDRQSEMLLQERASFGNLQTLLQSGDFQPSAKVLMEIFLQIVDAMIYIAGQGIVHCDLRCANVLVFKMDPAMTRENLAKLTNFRSTRTKDQSITDHRLPDTPVRYCAPEILRSKDGSSYSEKSDVYSMGVLMWEAYSEGEVPYGSRASDHDIQQQILNNQKLSRPQECHSQIWSVIEDCWCNEPEVRYDFTEIKQRISNANPKLNRRIPCYHCNRDIPEYELNDHQQLCVPQRVPVDVVERYNIASTQSNRNNEEYPIRDKENHPEPPPSKRARIKHTESTTRLTQSDYSDELYLDNTVQHYQKQSTIKKISVVSPKKVIQYSSCIYCDDEYPDDSIQQHQRTCPSQHSIPPINFQPIDFIQCRICNQQFSLDAIDAHEESCPPKPRSFMDYFLLCPCFPRRKN